MPIVIPKDIPANKALTDENIFVMDNERANTQDIRPVEIAIVNLMPTKIETETQLLRLLSNTPLQVNITFVQMSSHISKNTSKSHMEKFYVSYEDIKNQKFDGMIITGAPVEHLEYKEVEYFDELKKVFDFAEKNVTSTIYICWAAQAALYYHYNINKIKLDEKLFGIFPNKKLVKFEPLLNGIDDTFYIPHSRHTHIDTRDILNNDNLIALAFSHEAGVSILKSKDNKKIFITGHVEYDKYTLKNEYERDLNKGLKIHEPKNYFLGNDVNVIWRSTATIIYSNWLNYYVYQVTPYDLNKRIIKKKFFL